MTETGKIFKREKDMKKGQPFSCTSLLTRVVCVAAPPHFLSFCLQVSLFPLACQLTTVYAITPLWRVTRTSYWKTGILSKCKLSNLNSPYVLIHFLFPAGQAVFTSCFSCPACSQWSGSSRWWLHLKCGPQLHCRSDQGTSSLLKWILAALSIYSAELWFVMNGFSRLSKLAVPHFTCGNLTSLFRTTHRRGGRLTLSKQLTSVLRRLCVWLNQGTR